MGDKHRSAFNGYVFQSSQLKGDIYFAGDTALMAEYLTDPLFKNFNIKTSIQPGGPDEMREDMKSTHQSSADGILVHFRILRELYHKKKETMGTLSKAQFLEEAQSIKTIFNHTATFKLGNLRLKDTHYSLQRVIAAFLEGEKWAQTHLAPHEVEVYKEILRMANDFNFDASEPLSHQEIATLIMQSVVVPKIGQRQPLSNSTPTSFKYRDLITNRRALVEYDDLVKNYVKTSESFDVKALILQLFDAYQKPWHSVFSRHHRYLQPLLREIKACQSNEDLLLNLNKLDNECTVRNPHGHMQSLIYFAKWLMQCAAEGRNITPKQCLIEFYACKDVKQLVDNEIHHAGPVLLGQSRQEKQKLFMSLSAQLADLPYEVERYSETLNHWKTHVIHDGDRTTATVMSANRSGFFKRAIPRSEAKINEIEMTLGVAMRD